MDEDVSVHLQDCDEIWHAGDVGDIAVMEKLLGLNKKLRVVHGNIDSKEIKWEYPEDLLFEIGELKVFMTHIGGYPPRYRKRVRDILIREKPNLYICGHSHILKIMPDCELDLLHMNPGAIGHRGLHQVRTLITFHIVDNKIKDVQVVELGRRGDKN